MDGLLLVDKPKGWTSHDVVKKVKRVLSAKKAGHTGTLDPIATGLLVVCLNKATKLAGRLSGCDKEYEVTAQFGLKTDTYDSEGEVIFESVLSEDFENRLKEVLPRFVGRIEQRPPPFSAVKYNGRPLYWYARKGIKVPLRPRKVVVKSIKIVNIEGGRVEMLVSCSSGTYIRSLINDIGETLSCGAVVTALRRIRCGEFSIDRTVGMDEICKENFKDNAQLFIITDILK